jgi:hypothetical protein
MAIIQQCKECNKVGKNRYCNNCTKSIDYFDVIEYNNSRFANGEIVGKIKAYTWHDAIEFVRNYFYFGKNNLEINCDKDFAYMEDKDNFIPRDIENKKKDNPSYKLYLNNERNNQMDLMPIINKNIPIWDATIIKNA